MQWLRINSFLHFQLFLRRENPPANRLNSRSKFGLASRLTHPPRISPLSPPDCRTLEGPPTWPFESGKLPEIAVLQFQPVSIPDGQSLRPTPGRAPFRPALPRVSTSSQSWADLPADSVEAITTRRSTHRSLVSALNSVDFVDRSRPRGYVDSSVRGLTPPSGFAAPTSVNDSSDSPAETVFVRIVSPSASTVASLEQGAETRGASGVFRGGRTIDVAFQRPQAALRYAVFAREQFARCRISIHAGRFLDAELRGVAESNGPAHATLAALAEAAEPGQILMSDHFFRQLELSGQTAFDANSRDLGRIPLTPGMPPTHVHALVPEDHGPPPSLGNTNLPTFVDTFFGRDRELSTLRSQLEHNQIVTITGPAGIGKTRLAVEFAYRLRDRNREIDIWYVDLTRCDSLEDVAADIACVLGLPLSSGAEGDDPLVTLGRAVSGRGECLIILDGADRVGSGVAVGLQTLLPMAPAARWIVTTNKPLNLVPEQEFPLDGLRPPSAARLLESHRRTGRRLDLSESQLDFLVACAERLDGSPLGIRLAAGLVPVGPPDRILEQLDRIPRGDSEPVWALLLASIRELDTPTRRVLELLAAARAPVPVDAALEMGDRNNLQVERSIPELARRGLVDRTRRIRGRGRTFLSVSEAVRDALRTVVAEGDGELPDFDETFARGYRRRTRNLRNELQGPRQAESLDQIESERATIEEAVRRSLEMPDVSPVAAASALHPWYRNRGPRSSGREMLEEVIDTSDPKAEESRAELLIQLAELDELSDAPENSNRRLVEALQLLEESEERPDLIAVALARRHRLLRQHPELDGSEADDLLREAAEYADASRRARPSAVVALEQAVAARTEGDRETAVSALEEARRLADDVGQPELSAAVEAEMGRLAARTHRFDRSRRHFQNAVASLRKLECLPDVARVLADIGDVERHLGETDRAASYLREALQLARRSGELERIASIQLQLGRFLASELEFEAARDEFLEILDATEEFFWPELRGPARAFLAATEAALGRDDTARRTFERAETELANLEGSSWDQTFPLLEHTSGIAAVEHGLEEPVALRPPQRAIFDATQEIPGDDNALDAIRLVDRYLDRVESGTSRDSGESTRPTRPTLLVGANGGWFHAPGRDRVDISRRDAPRRIFRRLVRHRHQFPGVPLHIEHLADVGWPEEDLSRTTAKNRVYRAVSTLRDLGLRDILLTREPGYLLSPRFALRRISPHPPNTPQ